MAKEIEEQVDEVQTTDATQTTLGSFTIPDDHSSGMFILMFTARKVSSDDTTGGRIRGCFRRTTTGNVAVSVSNSNQQTGTGAGAAIVDASGNDIRIRVTGEAGETYDWASVWDIFFE